MNPIQCLENMQSARFSLRTGSISCVVTVRTILFFLAALLFFASGAWARPITEDEARNAAVNRLSFELKPMGSPHGQVRLKVDADVSQMFDLKII